jgi:1-aminocyclopropane-1-carboxylate deaminase/D-cysteine desulfhydrase-like pyridoxal-dependent ACC family enzyme
MHSLALFRVHPQLQKSVPWIPLGKYPTHVHRLEKLGQHLNCPSLWIKRDDQSSTIHGGNKVRMFEFVLADAKKKRRNALVCWGSLGSNQVMASCIFGREVGFTRISAVFRPQPIHDYVRRNLLIDASLGAKMDYAKSSATLVGKLLVQYLKYFNPLKGERPYLVPMVGSSPLSCLGYVNAAFELKEQIAGGSIPEPDAIFVTVGTGGTMAGLQLGVQMAGLKSEVIGVRVLDRIFCNEPIIAWEINRTINYLKRCGCDTGRHRHRAKDIILLHDYYGKEYAGPTEEGRRAIDVTLEHEQLTLDVTYTGKTMAALMDYVKEPENANKTILFWHTLNSVDLQRFLACVPEPNSLPPKFHCYWH